MHSSHPLVATSASVVLDGRTVLHGIDATFARGAVTAITGANGAGKSTLLEALAGVRALSRGSISRTGTVALVVQRVAVPEALPLVVHDVVAMGTWARGSARWRDRNRRDRTRASAVSVPTANSAPASVSASSVIDDALRSVDLAEFADRPFTALSGGQRQRVLLAQGIARGADIFLLDEPAAGLDVESRARTQRVLAAEAARGAAVVCVTHDPDAIAAADAVVRLDAGRVVNGALQECHGSAA